MISFLNQKQANFEKKNWNDLNGAYSPRILLIFFVYIVQNEQTHKMK